MLRFFQLITLLYFYNSTPVPKYQIGFEIGNNLGVSKFAVFLDPHCPDSRTFYKNLKIALRTEFNGSSFRELLSIRLHLFPLPYHRNVFLALKLFNLVETNYPHKFEEFLTIHFDSIEKLKEDNMIQTGQEIQNLFEENLALLLNEDKEKFKDMCDDPELEVIARQAFKYGAYNGVYETPTLFINQVRTNPVIEVDKIIELFKAHI